MSDIATDTRAIAERIRIPPKRRSETEYSDIELLKVHALRLASAFEEVRDEWVPAAYKRGKADLAKRLRERVELSQEVMSLASVMMMLQIIDKELED